MSQVSVVVVLLPELATGRGLTVVRGSHDDEAGPESFRHQGCRHGTVYMVRSAVLLELIYDVFGLQNLKYANNPRMRQFGFGIVRRSLACQLCSRT